MLVNYRPEYTHQWAGKTYYTQLRLDPLGKESAGEMLSALVGDAPELVPLKRLVLQRTEGNPLFMEEVVRNHHRELSSGSSRTGTGSSNSLRSTNQSIRF